MVPELSDVWPLRLCKSAIDLLLILKCKKLYFGSLPHRSQEYVIMPLQRSSNQKKVQKLDSTFRCQNRSSNFIISRCAVQIVNQFGNNFTFQQQLRRSGTDRYLLDDVHPKTPHCLLGPLRVVPQPSFSPTHPTVNTRLVFCSSPSIPGSGRADLCTIQPPQSAVPW